MQNISIDEFIKLIENISTDICPVCNNKVELDFIDYQIVIDGYLIKVNNLPQLECQSCSNTILTSKSKQIIMYVYEQCKENNKFGCEITPRELNINCNFCKNYNFKYDYRDYENIPGLGAMTNDGFLTPVYFKKEALIYFMHHPDYELNLFSESYGTFGYKDEFEIPFGINKNNSLIIWLGDLDKLDGNTLSYLQIHNIQSDHTLMHTEFYDAQLNVIWSEPIIERRIINLRNKFYDTLKSNLSLDLHHLDQEILKAIEDIKKPIIYSDNEIKPVISALHKILIEAVNIKSIKKFYEENVDTNNRAKEYKNWGSIKYYEYLMKYLSITNIKNLISPLYLLNDMRIIYFHLLSVEREDKLKKNITDTLGLNHFDTKEIYKKLIEKLKVLFDELNIALKAIVN